MKLGSLFLGSWLILVGLKSLIDLSFQYDHLVMGALAIMAGIFSLIRR